MSAATIMDAPSRGHRQAYTTDRRGMPGVGINVGLASDRTGCTLVGLDPITDDGRYLDRQQVWQFITVLSALAQVADLENVSRPAGRCPAWCRWHTEDATSGLLTHTGRDLTIGALAGGGVADDFSLSLSLGEADTEPRVWLDDRPFSLAEARAAGMALVELATTGGAR
jgi:hypothetical protein